MALRTIRRTVVARFLIGLRGAIVVVRGAAIAHDERAKTGDLQSGQEHHDAEQDSKHFQRIYYGALAAVSTDKKSGSSC